MKLLFPISLAKDFLLVCVLSISIVGCLLAQNPSSEKSFAAQCRVQEVNYKGWQAQQLSNGMVQLLVVPQNGGRLMQVIFAGHPYLFVNPEFEGKYIPPAPGKWFNYGGDKLWPLPEGNGDEQHWVGDSDVLDDGPFDFRKLSEGKYCEIELAGPADSQTGIQYTRTIRLDAGSARIRFHASMKNVTGHPVEWSVQSVSQYNTGDASSSSVFNRNFWTFTPANPSSSYLNRYHVRFGPAENPAVGVRDDGLFTLHYVHMAAELWIDSIAGWLAVVDANSKYAMIERFDYDATKSYPGKASVIFWTNGPEVRLGPDGTPALSKDGDSGPYYLEAELNSPMCRLRAGESCSFDTEWFPTRAGDEFHGVKDPGMIIRPLQATLGKDGKVTISGSFGVFYPGSLIAHFYNDHGSSMETRRVAEADPTQPLLLNATIASPGKVARVSLHLEGADGIDYGSLGESAVNGSPE